MLKSVLNQRRENSPEVKSRRHSPSRSPEGRYRVATSRENAGASMFGNNDNI